MTATARLQGWARSIKRDIRAVTLASRDPRVPWHVKALAVCVAAYALSPIDLIPDFIPVLGYLDDLVIVPLGIWLVVRMVPPQILEEHRAAALLAAESPKSTVAAIVIVAIWITLAAGAGYVAYRCWLA